MSTGRSSPIKIFWTEKRLEALSRTLLTLFQAFAIAGTVGGIFLKIPSQGLKIAFVVAMLLLLTAGLTLADTPARKEP